MKWLPQRNSGALKIVPSSTARVDGLVLKVLDGLPFLTVVVGPHGRISYLTASVYSLLGWTQAELHHVPVQSLFAPRDHARLQALLGTQRGSAPHSLREAEAEFSVLNKKGKVVFVKVSCGHVFYKNRRYVCLAMRHSLGANLGLAETREKMLAFKRASENKSRILVNISHEIRTALNGILGMVDLLASSKLEPEQRGFLNSVKTNSRCLRALLNDILDISKIEIGCIEIEKRPFDIVDAIQTVLDTFSSESIGRGLYLRLKNDSSHRVFIGDPFRISQVIRNLVDNALKFTSQGGVTVNLSGKPLMVDAERNTWALKLLVTDTGIGMPQEEQVHLFGSFYQANASIARKYGGTGLGLNLSRQLVELMGGKISVTSRIGIGTEFEVTLELEETFRHSNFIETLPPAGLERLSGSTVLIVEDDFTNQVLLQAWLKAEGITTVLCANGRDALDYVMSGGSLDAVLMDVSMPVMDGIKTTRQIRAASGSQTKVERKYLAKLPIIGISGHAFERERINCLVAGMNGYLTKPLSRTTVLEELERVISEKHR